MALYAVTTHDLPTLYGYWSGRDLEVKKQLGIIGRDSQYAQQKRYTDRELKKLILKALHAEGFVPGSVPADSP